MYPSRIDAPERSSGPKPSDRSAGPLGTGLLLLLLSACTPAISVNRGYAVPTSVPEASLGARQGSEVALYAMALLDRDYRFGGTNPESGLDCSGMASYIYLQAVGLSLPHNAAKMAQLGRAVARDRLVPGDLVFFNTTGTPFSHVGVYVGNNRFIHAPRTNGKIKTSSLGQTYFSKRYLGARRYVG